MVLLLDVPSRISWPLTTNNTSFLSRGVSYDLRNRTLPRKPYVSSINMGASGTNDCIAYINKLESFGNTYSRGKLLIKPSAGGYANTNWYFDDNRPNPILYPPGGLFARNAILSNGVPSSSVTYAAHGEPHLTRGTNIAGFFTWGYNGGLGGDYATDGTVQFTGNAGWVMFQTAESFNGQRSTHQGNFIDWFSASAFGGSGYSNTPVAAVTTVDEPYEIAPSSYFGLWVIGKNFAICAWAWGNTYVQPVGDPFISR